LKRHFPAFSHGAFEKWLRKGEIRLDGKRASASSHLEAGQSLRLPPQLLNAPAAETERPLLPRADWLRARVLFEDDDIVALDKPAGLAVQGGTGLRQNLDDLLMIFSRDGKTKPKLVHRLDRETSGVLLIARSDLAARRLAEAFRERETRKIYWALTLGAPERTAGEVRKALVRRGEKMVCASPGTEGAQAARTLYRVEDSAKGLAAFVIARPLTGRTHQIRVHLAALGAPILGDRLYGRGEADLRPEWGRGLHLHARRLIMPHPRKGTIDVTAPLGEEMKKTWDWLGFDSRLRADFSDA
jgi:23S rRNA pseudouridine955/2504/2580 synthase